jgi:hypothetical protein
VIRIGNEHPELADAVVELLDPDAPTIRPSTRASVISSPAIISATSAVVVRAAPSTHSPASATA